MWLSTQMPHPNRAMSLQHTKPSLVGQWCLASVSLLASISACIDSNWAIAVLTSLAMSELRAECSALCRLSHSLDASGLLRLEQLVEGLKAHLQAKVSLFMKRHQHNAILVCYSADATPVLVASTSKMSSASLGSTRRSGRQLIEFLMQKSFYKSFSVSGAMDMTVVLKDPLPLSEGKRGWNMFTAAAEFQPLLRRAGHPSTCLQHMCADRAVFSSLDRHLRGRQGAFYDPAHGPDHGRAAPLLNNTDWMLSSPCAVHDAHNGLKWGLDAVTESTTLEDLHIAVESLRNSFAAVRAHITPFLQRRLRFHNPPLEASDGDCALWVLLGLEADWVEVIMGLNPLWKDGWLFVNDVVEPESTSLEQVSHLIFHLMRWRQFTQSRWASLGASCRALLASLLLGLTEIVSITRDNPHVSDYHLGGFERLSEHVMRFAIVCAAGAYPIENFIQCMLHDDRLLRRLSTLEEDLQEEVHYLEHLPADTWSRFASLLADGSPGTLQSGVLHVAHVSIAYLHEKTLAPAREYPWSLCVGNIDFNIHQLAVKATPPEEAVAAKIWHLSRVGFPQAQLHEALLLMREVPWSTQGVERSHGSIASVHKFHPQYGFSTLAARAMLHQSRALFQQAPEAEALQKKEAQLAKLQRSLSRSVSARNVFLAEVMSANEASSSFDGEGRALGPHDVVRLSHRLYEQLDVRAKLRYEALALEATSARRASLLQTQDQLTQTYLLDEARQRQEQQAEGLLNTLASCRFSDGDFASMAEFVADEGLKGQALQALRRRAVQAPAEPPPHVQQVFKEAFEREDAAEEVVQPDWIKTVCRHRELFARTAFFPADTVENIHEGYLLLVAFQSPLKAVFLKISVRFPVLGLSVDARGKHTSAEWCENWFQWEFIYDSLQCVSSAEVEDPSEILILEHLDFIGQTRLVSDMQLRNLGWTLQTLRREPVSGPKESDSKAHKSRKRVAEEQVSAFPWLQAHLQDSAQKRKKATVTNKGQPPTSSQPDSVGEEPMPPSFEEVWERLNEKRAEWGDTLASEAFYIQVRGGAWNAEHRNVAFDSLMAAAKKGVASEWAKTFHVGQIITFAYSLYSEEAAYKMAEAWVRKCQQFFRLYLEKDCNVEPYTDAELRAYKDTDFDSWVDALPVGSPTAKRAGSCLAWPDQHCFCNSSWL